MTRLAPLALLTAALAVPAAAFADDSSPEGSGEAPAAERWHFAPIGYVRVAYEHTQQDPDLDFIGRTSGFRMLNARVGVEGSVLSAGVSFELTVDGAVDSDRQFNALEGDIDVELRDAWLRWDPCPWAGLQAGQFTAPFSREALRSTSDLLLSTRALGEEGILVGTGLELDAIVVDRELGLLLSPEEPIEAGPIGIDYGVALLNGNGSNELLNDNTAVAVAGRLELIFVEIAHIGGGVLHNQRTDGLAPNRFRERDLAWVADAGVEWEGLEVYGQLMRLKTARQTEGTPDREQQAWHAQVGYSIDVPHVSITPAYRFASVDPWAGTEASEGVSLDTFAVQHHTAGVRLEHAFATGSIRLHLDYTVAVEDESRSLDNNTFRALAQVAW